MTTLVVVATRAEAAHVPAGLDVVVTGLGKTAAAVATTRAILERDRDGLVVVNIGSAGALRDGVEGLHEVGTVLNHDISAESIRALGYDPQEELHVGDSGVVLASGDVFVTDPAVRDDLALFDFVADRDDGLLVLTGPFVEADELAQLVDLRTNLDPLGVDVADRTLVAGADNHAGVERDVGLEAGAAPHEDGDHVARGGAREVERHRERFGRLEGAARGDHPVERFVGPADDRPAQAGSKEVLHGS